MKPIYEDVMDQQEVLRNHKRWPQSITFSNKGYDRARAEESRHRCSFNINTKGPPTHYIGLPFHIDRKQVEPILVNPKETADARP